MPPDNNINAPPSAATSHSAPTKRKPISESAFLSAQAADARQAISQVAHEIAGDAKGVINPRRWVDASPWISVAAAGVAGFLAAVVVVPTKQEDFAEHWQRLKEKFTPSTPSPDARADDGGNGAGNGNAQSGSWRGSFTTALAWHLVQAIQPIVTTVLTAIMSAKPHESTGNGRYPEPNAGPKNAADQTQPPT